VSPAWIRTRQTASGEKRYLVLYRRGGRTWPMEAAGTFKTLKEARVRRDYVGGEIAAGRDPRDSLRKTVTPRRTLDDWFELWLKTRIDVDERTRENYRVHWKRIEPRFGRRRPENVEHGEIQEWINEQLDALTPRVLRDYLGTLRQVLDHAGLEPNPARHRAIRLPTAERVVHTPPSDEHVLAMLDAMTPQHYDDMFNINVRGPFFQLQSLLPLLGRPSAVVFTSSVAASIAFPTTSLYSATKAAIVSFGKTLAVELAPRGIRVNVLSPGPIDTPIIKKLGLPADVQKGFEEANAAKSLLKRFGTPQEVARLARFLLSEESSYIIGAEILIDGGVRLT